MTCVASILATTLVAFPASRVAASLALSALPDAHAESSVMHQHPIASQMIQRRAGRLVGPGWRAVLPESVLILVRHLDGGLVDVDAGCLWRGVSKDCLYRRFANPAPDHFGGQSVPERVWRDFALDDKDRAELTDDVLDRARADGVADIADLVPPAEGRRGAGATDRVAPQVPVRLERLGRFGIEMDRPALATLGPVNMRLPIGQLDIAASEGAQLRNAHAGPEEHQDDCPHLEGTELLDLVLVPLRLADIFDNPLEVTQLHVRRRRREARHHRGNPNPEPVSREGRMQVVGDQVRAELAHSRKVVLGGPHLRDLLG